MRHLIEQLMEDACTRKLPTLAQLAFPFFSGPFEVRRVALGAGAGSQLRVAFGPWGADLWFRLPATTARLDEIDAAYDATLARPEDSEFEEPSAPDTILTLSDDDKELPRAQDDRPLDDLGENDEPLRNRPRICEGGLPTGSLTFLCHHLSFPLVRDLRRERLAPLRSWHIDLRFLPRAEREGPWPWPRGEAVRFVPCLGTRRQESLDAIHALVVFFAAAQRQIAGAVDQGRLRAAARLLVAAAAYVPPDPDLRALAASRPFPATDMLHAFVYDAVTQDLTGRLAQMVDVCPGLLAFARGLATRGGEDRVQELLTAIVQGRKLGAILDLAVEAWARQQARSEPSRPAPSLRERAIQRQWIRHADACLPPALLWGRFVPGLVIEDIPRQAEIQQRWFEITTHEALWPPPRGAQAPVSEARHRRFVAFLSKHWAFFDGVVSFYLGPLEELLPEIIDFLGATGQTPDRSSDPVDVFSEFRSWREGGRPEEDDLKPFPAETALDIRGLSCWEEDGTRIRPLGRVAELIDEGCKMQHCVADYAGRAVNGKVQIFHLTGPSTELTVMTERRSDNLKLLMALGQSNRPLRSEEETLLRRWLETTATHES